MGYQENGCPKGDGTSKKQINWFYCNGTYLHQLKKLLKFLQNSCEQNTLTAQRAIIKMNICASSRNKNAWRPRKVWLITFGLAETSFAAGVCGMKESRFRLLVKQSWTKYIVTVIFPQGNLWCHTLICFENQFLSFFFFPKFD